MLALMLRRSLVKGMKRKLLAIVTVALGASLATVMLNLSVDVGDKVARELRSYGANLAVRPQASVVDGDEIADRDEALRR